MVHAKVLFVHPTGRNSESQGGITICDLQFLDRSSGNRRLMLVQMRIDSQRSCGFGLIRQLLLCAVMGWAAGVSAEAVEKTERWSFQPRGTVVPPILQNKHWIKNPIAAFVLLNLQPK